MTKREDSMIDPELIQALRADAAGAPDAAVQARVFAGIEERLVALAAPVAAAACTAATATQAAASAPSALPLPAAASSTAASSAAPSLLVSALSKSIGIAMVTATVGGAGTYALSEYTHSVEDFGAQSTSAPARIETPPRPAVPTFERAPSVEPRDAPRDAPAAPEKVVRRSSKASGSTAPRAPDPRAKPPSGASLGEQQALLDAARTALARGESRAVLETLSAHSNRYPDSDLVEEREALAIKALVAAGQYAAARERGARFQQRFPNSLLAPSVTAALRSIP